MELAVGVGPPLQTVVLLFEDGGGGNSWPGGPPIRVWKSWLAMSILLHMSVSFVSSMPMTLSASSHSFGLVVMTCLERSMSLAVWTSARFRDKPISVD